MVTTGMDRRALMAGLTVMGAAPEHAAAAPPSAVYDYLFFNDAAPVPSALVASTKGTAAVLARFTPQLGWANDQSALLIGRDAGEQGGLDEGAVSALTRTLGVEHHRLTATARPNDVSPPWPGGIYVHRWFIVPDANVPEFVELSVQGWRDFETRYDARIYGLFHSTSAEGGPGIGDRRLLLLTRYASHSVWEISRDPRTDAMATFRRRQALTRRTWAASTLLSTS